MKTKLVTWLIIGLALMLCLCGSSPMSPSGADGSFEKPTIPMSVALDSEQHLLDTTVMVTVVEIYDIENMLVIFSEAQMLKSDLATDLKGTFYWNCLDKNGNPVESGKYTVKMSFFTSDTVYCDLRSVYVKKFSAPVDSSAL